MAESGKTAIGVLQIDNATGELLTGSVGTKAFLAAAFDQSTLERNTSDGTARVKPDGIGRSQSAVENGKLVRADLLAADTGGGIAGIVNPFGVPVIIVKCLFQVTTVATGACTVDVGVGAGITTSFDNLLDGIDVNAAVALFGAGDEGTNGVAQQVWATGEHLTASKATGAAAGLAGYISVLCYEIAK